MTVKHNLLVLGSQNSKEADQKLDRSEIRPVQLLTREGKLLPINFFNNWGEAGVSSIQWDLKRFPSNLFVSINDEIRKLNVENKNFDRLNLGTVGDIHDIHFLDDGYLWISNTEYDEAIAYNPETDEVVRRESLDPFRKKINQSTCEEEFAKVKDRFHCNQVFRDFNDDLCVLIHSISGWQYYRVLLEKLVKKQGDGGVINLIKNDIIPLKLQSPHTVRKIDQHYWIQDSGDLSTKIYDKNWSHVDTIKTGGFGRGVDFSEADDIAYVGLSATRKRYLKVIPASEYHSNRILTVNISGRTRVNELPIPNIEQLDNVYILNKQVKALFERLT